MLAMPPQMNTCELCQVPGCSNSLYTQLHSCVPMSPASCFPPIPSVLMPGVQHAAQTTHLQQSLADLERGSRSTGELVWFKSNLQLLAIKLQAIEIILYVYTNWRSKVILWLGN